MDLEHVGILEITRQTVPPLTDIHDWDPRCEFTVITPDVLLGEVGNLRDHLVAVNKFAQNTVQTTRAVSLCTENQSNKQTSLILGVK